MLARLGLILALACGLGSRLAAAGPAAPAPAAGAIRIACVGDSITHGYQLPSREAYPAVLGRLLGPGYTVGNFGVSGATLLKRGHLPYWDQPAFRNASDFGAQIVIIKLGTNDGAARNWSPHGREFAADAAALIAHFQRLPTKPTVYVCLPAPVFGWRGVEVTENRPEIRRLLREAAAATGVRVIDTYTPFLFKSVLFPDGLHPNATGAALLAQTIAEALQPKARSAGR